MQGKLILQEEAVCFKAGTKHTSVFCKGTMSFQTKKSDTLQNVWEFASSEGIISYSFCTTLSTIVGPMTDWHNSMLFLVFLQTFIAQFSLFFSHNRQKHPDNLYVCYKVINQGCLFHGNRYNFKMRCKFLSGLLPSLIYIPFVP